MTTIIIPCNCHHIYQDEKYGKGMRVHNLLARVAQRPPEGRCTVCEKVKPVTHQVVLENEK